MSETIDLNRRAVLRGGALVLGFTLLPRHALAEFNGMGVPPISNKDLAGSLQRTPMLDAWIRIAADGKVTVFTGKVELGTGVRTALLQVAAEQLDVAPAAINFITADTALTPNEGFTAGSHTMADSGTALLNAAAQVRAGAARRGGAAQGRRGAAHHQQRHRQRRRRPPAALRRAVRRQPASGRESQVAAERSTRLQRHRQSLPRVDIPAKLTGGAAYVQDLRMPGMVHARVVRPPAPGAKLLSADIKAAQQMPGVLKVHLDGSYLAVIASDEWQAVQAMRALYASARWSPGPGLARPDNIHATLRALPSQDIVIADKTGRHQGRSHAQTPLHRQYVCMARSVLLLGGLAGRRRDDGLDAHAGVYPLRAALAESATMPLDAVRCIHTEGAGCYGQNGADDVAADAALLARGHARPAVRVQLMRDQEHQWEPYAPAMSSELSASLDASGKMRLAIRAVERLSQRAPRQRRQAAAGPIAGQAFHPEPVAADADAGRRRRPQCDSALHAAAQRIVNHFLPVTPLRSAMRSLGAPQSVCHRGHDGRAGRQRASRSGGVSPAPPRRPARARVIERAAREFGWSRRKKARDHGFGFAFGQYKNIWPMSRWPLKSRSSAALARSASCASRRRSIADRV
jgi:hypothetical protein